MQILSEHGVIFNEWISAIKMIWRPVLESNQHSIA